MKSQARTTDARTAQSRPSPYEIAMKTLEEICQTGDAGQRLRAAELLLHATGYVR